MNQKEKFKDALSSLIIEGSRILINTLEEHNSGGSEVTPTKKKASRKSSTKNAEPKEEAKKPFY